MVLETLEAGPISAQDLKEKLAEKAPDMELSDYRHLMTSLIYAGDADNVGLKRLTIYVITDLGQIKLDAIRKSHRG